MDSNLGQRTPGAVLTARALQDTIEPWVNRVRDEVEALGSGAASLPFSDYSEAFTWVRRQRAGDNVAWPDEESARRSGGSVYRPKLFLPKPEGGLVVLQAGEGSVRRVLNDAAREMAKCTGFSEGDLLRHILTGVELELTPVTIAVERNLKMGDGVSIARIEVVVRFRTPEVTVEHIRKIHGVIRGAWSAHREKPLTNQQLLLDESVRSLGGVPKEGKTDFWEKVRKRVGRDGGVLYSTWRGCRQAYERLGQKLADRSRLGR